MPSQEQHLVYVRKFGDAIDEINHRGIDMRQFAAGAPDRLMNLTDEAGRASARRAYPAPGFLPAAAIPNLAGTNPKVVIVVCHETTIGSRTLSRKTRNAVRVMQRGNSCAGEDTAISNLQHVTGDGCRSIEKD